MQKGGRRPPRHESVPPPDHDEHHGQAKNQHAVILQLAEALQAANQNHRCDNDAELAAEAAKHDDCENHCGFHECE